MFFKRLLSLESLLNTLLHAANLKIAKNRHKVPIVDICCHLRIILTKQTQQEFEEKKVRLLIRFTLDITLIKSP